MTVARDVVTAAGAGSGAAGRAPATPQAVPLRGAQGAQDDDVLGLGRVPAHDVASVGRAEGPGQLDLGEAEERRQSPWRPCGALDLDRVLRGRDADGRVVDLRRGGRSASIHWPGLRTAPSCCPSLRVRRRTAGGSRRGCGRRGRPSRACCRCRRRSSGVMIWCGFIVPWSVSSRRIVMSVIEPSPWWPRIGMPLIAAMSTALPEECSETLPDVGVVAVAAAQRADRRLQAATRRGTRASPARGGRSTPARMSRRPQLVDVDARVGEHACAAAPPCSSAGSGRSTGCCASGPKNGFLPAAR